ncbi:MAG: helix-turn-helix domain-containing protein [Leptospiraceae bacterium]|nr:helix-turn-helix domain-containing protein [Leptospiraceae bacterium]MCP5501067.1 helix-turn-helix domain-containing protein [Leptospiraceae bacterium]
MKKNDYKNLFSYLNLKQKEFAEKYGMQPSNLSEIVNGRSKSLPIQVVLRLNKEHNISIEWLVNGTGDMLEVKNSDTLTDKEKELLSEVRKDPKLLDTLKGIIESLKKNYK